MKNSLIFIFLLTLTACAVIQSPVGGEKDVKPPQIISEKPELGTINYNKSSVEIKFDEFIVAKDFAREILVSPSIKTLKSKYTGKGVKLYWQEKLKANTTYSFQFLNTIVDINEGNVLPGYQFTFATGPIIDSLSISGTVSNPTLEPIEELSIQLIDENDFNDSSFLKSDFNFVTFSDKHGHFDFNYLPYKSFKLFGFEDKNSNKTWDDNERVAFMSETISSTDTNAFKMVLFNNENAPKFKRAKHKRYNCLEMDFETSLPDYSDLRLLSNHKEIAFKAREKENTLELFFNESEVGDSLTLLTGLDTFSIYKANHKNSKIDIEHDGEIQLLNEPVWFTSNYPIQTIDTSYISLILNGDSLLNYTIVESNDPYKFGISYAEITTPVQVNMKWRAVLYKDSIFNKSFTENITKHNLENLAIIDCKFKKHDLPYIVQLYTESNTLVEEKYLPQNETTLRFNRIISGNYKIRYIIDADRNKRFTSGSLQNEIQPERIIINKGVITLKPNWVTELLF